MNLDQTVLAFAGTVVLVSLALGWLVSPYWLLLTAFAGRPGRPCRARRERKDVRRRWRREAVLRRIG